MTNEELVQRTKSGEKDCMPELWEKVRRFIVWRAKIFTLACDDPCKTEQEDLIQSGYFALLNAIEKYDPEAGYSFLGYFNYYLRKQFRKEAGIWSSRRDALLTASSMDAPLPADDEGDLTLHDVTPLPSAEAEFDEAIEQLGNRYIFSSILECIQKLRPIERDVLLEVYVQQRRLKDIAVQIGVSDSRVQQIKSMALRHLRTMPAFCKIKTEYYLDDHTQFYKHKGYRAFNTTFSSVVEDSVLKREEKREQWERPRSLI